jgi:GNAT superfamily N-acetyltransferase
MEFRRVGVEPKALSGYEALMRACFPQARKYSGDYLGWLYRDNPEGLALGFDALDGDRLAAHYVCIPVKAAIGGQTVTALLSLNTATDPAYQGRGLFTRLAEMTYRAAAEEGFDAVYGVANASSTPGFVRKLGFQLVEPLQARIGIGALDLDLDTAREAQFERAWSAASLKWRCDNPANPVFYRKSGERVQFHAAAKGMLLPAYAELSARGVPDAAKDAASFLSVCRLFIGLAPNDACRFRNYAAIPQRFRPSPLNFIYRSLSRRIETLEQGHLSFSFLDFDAY